MNLASGQVQTWPLPAEPWHRNAFMLDAMHRVWRVAHLYHKPRAIRGETNWTPEDVDLWDWLENG